jgi:hypothetical protein
VKHIRFIVTGDLERAAIVASLSRLFPPQTAAGELVEWLRPRKVHGATTRRLQADREPDAGMRALARAMVAEAWEGAGSKPADLVIVVDDVELHNFDQRGLICEHFRTAVERELERRAKVLGMGAEQRMRNCLRERCSFHLLCPMVEAYLFGDRHALRRAGCGPGVRPRLVNQDVEEFESTDPQWLPHCRTTNRRQADPPMPMPWWREERHAKHYLEHLAERSGAHYDEVVAGVAAFSRLDWRQVAASGGPAPLAWSLFEDVADFFAVPNPLSVGAGSSLTYPARHVHRASLTLRNL